jgi:hypothetical protein
MFLQRRFSASAKFPVVQCRPRGANDPKVFPKVFGKKPVAIQAVERRQQHAPGKISRRAEQQKGGNLVGHGRLLSGLVTLA